MYELSIIEVRPISIVNANKNMIIMSALSSYVYDHHIDTARLGTTTSRSVACFDSLVHFGSSRWIVDSIW